MRNVWTIARREYKLFFISPVAYVVAFFFMLLLGIFFYINLRDAILQAQYQAYAPSVQIVISPMVTLLIFVLPAVSMRSIAEEIRMGTTELLFTAPVKDWELVVGKWLGAFLFILTILAVTLIYVLLESYLQRLPGAPNLGVYRFGPFIPYNFVVGTVYVASAAFPPWPAPIFPHRPLHRH